VTDEDRKRAKDKLETIERMRRRGELTAAEASAKIDHFGLRDAIEPAQGVVRETDKEIAQQLLVSSGVTEAQAWKRVATNAEAEIAALGDQVGQRRATLQNIASEHAAHEFAQSPEGRKLEAAQLADDEAKLAHEAGLAERYIRHRGLADDGMLTAMSAQDKVALAFEAAPDASPVAVAINRHSKYARDPETVDGADPAANLKAAGLAKSKENQ
jgi:hypothetical protein